MIFIDTCPKCGSDLNTMLICTYPPINRVECPCCGWYNESKNEIIRNKFNVDYNEILDKNFDGVKTND